MFTILRIEGHRKVAVSHHESFGQAVHAACAAFYPITLDLDPDHIGCADLLACDGTQYAIEPTNWRFM